MDVAQRVASILAGEAPASDPLETITCSTRACPA
jgi:hypothetical protein